MGDLDDGSKIDMVVSVGRNFHENMDLVLKVGGWTRGNICGKGCDSRVGRGYRK